MTITCDTALSEILDHNTVCNPISEMNNKAQGLLETRTGALQSVLQTGGGCSSAQLIDGVPVFFNSGKEVYEKYGTLADNISTYATTVSQLAVSKEMEELGELSTAIVKKIGELDDAIEDALAAEAALMESEGVDAVTGEQESTRLIRERERYRQKLEQVNTRIRTLDPAAEVMEAPALPGIEGGGGAENDGAGDSDVIPDQSYTIPTEGQSTEQMYNSGKQLEAAMNHEQAYLLSAMNGIEYTILLLETQHDAGLISDEVYAAALADYNARLEIVQNAIYERSEVLSVLQPATVDNMGTDDGWLKDSTETAFYGGTLEEAGNEQNTANRVEQDINSVANQVTPLNQVIADAGLNGTSPLYSGNVQNNPYGQALYNSQYGYTSYDGISQATQSAAFDYATHTNTTTEVAPGVYCYSVREYLNSDPYSPPPNMGNPAGNEWYTMDTGSYAFASPDGSGDTVYDSNTGEYYSWAAWNEKQNGGQNNN